MIRHLSEYVKKTSEKDVTLATVLAVNDCQDGDTLCLGGGELHFYPRYAMEKEYYISNNDFGVKAIAFLLQNRKNFTIDGEGATLLFHGKMLPFVIDGCEDITIRNVTIDYAEPMYFEGVITDSGEDFVEMVYDESRFHVDIQEGAFRFFGEGWENVREYVLVNEFDPIYKGPVPKSPTYFAHLGRKISSEDMHSSMYRYLSASKPAANCLRLEGDIGYRHTVGKKWLCTHCRREYPGIFAGESGGLLLEHVCFTHTLAMGLICQLCEDITLDHVAAVAGKESSLSVNADVTHFVNCTGRIHMKDCSFESMMDDACNIHGIYMPVDRKLDDRKVLLSFGHPQQRGVNIFKPGDKIHLIDNRTLQPCSGYTVKAADLLSKEYLLLETEEDLPVEIPQGFVFENPDRMPEVHIENCNSGYNRPRGFLLTTGKDVLVEGCSFHNISHAIAITGDANSWYESGGCGQIILRNNRFDNAAYSGGVVILADPQIQEAGEKAYHRSLVIENNYFRTNGERFLYAKSLDRVVFRGNVFEQDDTLAYNDPVGTDGFQLTDCRQVIIEEPIVKQDM